MVIRFESPNPPPPRIVEMNADEDGTLLLVLNRDALLERNENIRRPRHHDFQIRFTQSARKTLGDIERRTFLRAAKFAVSAVVFPTVSGIDDAGVEGFARISCADFSRPGSRSACGQEARRNNEYESATGSRHLRFLH